MSNQFCQFPWKGQFSLGMLLLVTKLIALGMTSAPATAKTHQPASHSSNQAAVSEIPTQSLEVTPEKAIYTSESDLNELAPLVTDQDQLQVDIVQTLDGTLIAQARRPEEELSDEELNIEDVESDY